MSKFSYFVRPIGRTIPKWECEISDIGRYLRESRARAATEALRQIDEVEARRQYKAQNFDFVTFSGKFSERNQRGLIEHTGLMCLDYDHIGGQAEIRAAKQRLAADTSLRAQLIFTSPSGDGLKLVVRAAAPQRGDPEKIARWHEQVYKKIAAEIEKRHGLKSDKTSDVTRACFVGWDPEVWEAGVGFSPRTFRRVVETITFGGSIEKREISSWEKVEQAVREIERTGRNVTSDYRDWIRLGFGLAHELGEEGREMFHRASRYHPHYSKEESDRKYTDCMMKTNGRVRLGTVLRILKNGE